MQPLRAIWCGKTPEDTMQVVYVSRSGRRFAPEGCVAHERDLVDRQRIFSGRRRPRAEEDDQPDDSEWDDAGTLML
jgi:hypothetical protein